MTTAFDRRMANMALRLSERYRSGKDTLVRLATTFDPATGMSSGTPRNIPVQLTPPVNVQKQFINGETILATDMQCYMPTKGNPTVPDAATDKLLINGVARKILQVDPLQSGDDIAAYRIIMRTGPA